MSDQSPNTQKNLLPFKEILQIENTPLKRSPYFTRENKSFFTSDRSHSGNHNRTVHFCGSRVSLEYNPSISLQSLSGVFLSPNTNFVNSSPNSIEKWIESYSREKINVMKLFKFNQEIKNKVKSKENSRHSSAKKPKDYENSNLYPQSKSAEKLKEKLFTEDFFAKKNLMILFDNNNNNFNAEENLNILNRKTERIEEDNFSDKEYLSKNLRSNLGDILCSPRRKDSIDSFVVNEITDLNKEESSFSSVQKKKIFECSAQKSLCASAVKSCCAPTLTSSEKKERRRLRKTSDQLQFLQDTYQDQQNKDWSKEMIINIAGRIGLEWQKVYKWFWDKKNKEMTDKKVFFIQSASKNDIGK